MALADGSLILGRFRGHPQRCRQQHADRQGRGKAPCPPQSTTGEPLQLTQTGGRAEGAIAQRGTGDQQASCEHQNSHDKQP